MGPFVLLHISIGFRFVKPKWTGGVHNKGKFSCSTSAIVMTKMIITESDSSIPFCLLWREINTSGSLFLFHNIAIINAFTLVWLIRVQKIKDNWDLINDHCDFKDWHFWKTSIHQMNINTKYAFSRCLCLFVVSSRLFVSNHVSLWIYLRLCLSQVSLITFLVLGFWVGIGIGIVGHPS